MQCCCGYKLLWEYHELLSCFALRSLDAKQLLVRVFPSHVGKAQQQNTTVFSALRISQWRPRNCPSSNLKVTLSLAVFILFLIKQPFQTSSNHLNAFGTHPTAKGWISHLQHLYIYGLQLYVVPPTVGKTIFSNLWPQKANQEKGEGGPLPPVAVQEVVDYSKLIEELKKQIADHENVTLVLKQRMGPIFFSNVP